MKKYNLSAIMKRAWHLVKKTYLTLSSALKKAWKEAKMEFIGVKEWFYDKEHDKATRYNIFMDYERDENGLANIVDGYIFLKVEKILGKSEKAIHVRISSGDVVGSYKGWTCWIPKSLIFNSEV